MTPSSRTPEPRRAAKDPVEMRSSNPRRIAWLIGGAVLAGGMGLSVWAGVTGEASSRVPLAISVALGGVYLVLLALHPLRATRGVWTVTILVAVLMRLPFLFVPPATDADYWRYFWDGAVVAHGISPYRHVPQDVADGRVDDPTLQRLARTGRGALERISHPHLRTIYPPVAQGAFAMGYWIAPFDLTGWRLVLLGFDAVAALAVCGLLRRAGLPLSLMFIYLWNPLLIAETYGGGHVDLLAGAMVAVFAWSLAAKRPIVAGSALALAVGAKLWPVLLLPCLLRGFWGRWRSLALSSAVVVVGLAALAVPFAAAFGTSEDSGLLTYACIWESRAGAYEVFDKLGWWMHERYDLSIDGQYVARGLMLLVLLPTALWLGLRGRDDVPSLCRRMGLVVLLMLLLGPVLWPWYYVAVIPLAAVAAPRAGLLLWTALLPLCYLEGDGFSVAHPTWWVHAPVWATLVAEWVAPRFRRRFGKEARDA